MATHVVESCYTSAACNRAPHTLDWGTNNIVCYASCRNIMICDPEYEGGSAQILQSLAGHFDRINCVRWIRSPFICKDNNEAHNDSCTEDVFLSCSTDATAVVWKKQKDQYKPVYHLKGHEDAVTVGDGISVPSSDGNTLLLITASADSTVMIWEITNTIVEVAAKQCFKFGSGFGLDVRFGVLPGCDIICLAVAMDNCNIDLYIKETEEFVKIHSLKGHEDWIRSLDFALTDDDSLLLVSGGQDCLIRLWKISQRSSNIPEESRSVQELDPHEDIKLKENIITANVSNGRTFYFAVSLESIMAGHENWVYGVHWHPRMLKGSKWHQPLRLLSSSMDKTMILWSPAEPNGMWLEEVRVGEVGGNNVGFYGSKFSPDGRSIIAHGYQGAFHLWCCTEEAAVWNPKMTVSGHFSEVLDISWDPRGEYVISASVDQTTRLHGPWVRKGSKVVWHELARPQVHGYDMSCVTTLSRYKFVSGADEKVLRVFDAPKKFLENFCHLSGIDLMEETKDSNAQSLPEGASVPALSLSNRAVYDSDRTTTETKKSVDRDNEDSGFIPYDMKEPPTEEKLLQSTLWPETHKLYGHGTEVFCVASNSKGTLVASACKATSAENAAILLWETGSWRQVAELQSHNLTVTQLAFSPNDLFLLSVSRDRTWTVFVNEPSSKEVNFRRTAYSDKKTGVHSRIIWACAWTPDSKFFATGSRDKKVVMWGKTGKEKSGTCLGEYSTVEKPLQTQSSVTALDFCPVMFGEVYLLSVGLETGEIAFYSWTMKSTWTQLSFINNDMGHHMAVKRLKFRPEVGTAGDRSESDKSTWQLASCGADFSVRVYNLIFNL